MTFSKATTKRVTQIYIQIGINTNIYGYFTTILYFFIFSDVNLETRWSRKYVFLR